MKLLQTDFNKNPNIGLYAYTTDKYCLIGKDLTDSLLKELETVLQVPVYRVSIAGTNLIGAFCSGNNKKLLIPKMCFNDELERLKELKIKFSVVDTELTALGNNILCTEKGAYINPEFSDKEVEQLKKLLDVPVIKGMIGDVEVTGATGVIRKNHAVISPYVTDEQLEKIQHHLHVTAVKCTANFGSPYLKSALVVNSKGFIAGKLCTGVELDDLYRGLGFK